MPDTYQSYDITLSGGGNTLDLTITVDLSQTDKIDTVWSDNSGHPVTAVSGTFNGLAITGLIATNGYLGNDNLYVAGAQPLDYSGISFTTGTGASKVDYNLFYHVGNGDNGWTLDTGNAGKPSHLISNGTFSITTVCFVTGTLIETTRGQIAVEDLAIGDLAVTASGAARPITWIGQRTIRAPMPAEQPVRVMAGAFGEGLPRRDLFLSPGHAVCVSVMDEVFAPIDHLINGATIAQVEVPEVTYWHVELESHDVLLAEGLPAESYMDCGNRAWFGREHGRLQAVDAERDPTANYARPFVDRGPVVDAIRQRLTARAEFLGWTRTADMDLHLLVDGRRFEPEIDGDLARFIFPAEAKTAALVSKTFVPAGRSPSGDRRTLGVRLDALRISDGMRLSRDVPLQSLDGVHPEEAAARQPWRWTNGRLELPAELWAGANSQVFLTLTHKPQAAWAWVAPQVPLAANMVRAA